jgi:uncharacterized protein YndB with AHSA1/START domain
MITDSSVEIEAAPGAVWDVFVDVERWPEWTASVTTLVALDGPALEVGRRFEIKQPRMPKLVWVVTELDPGVSWSWEQRSPGGLTVASHELIPDADGRTLVRQRIDQRGPVGTVVGVLMRRLTRKYLELEGQGLKAASEGLRRRDGSSA